MLWYQTLGIHIPEDFVSLNLIVTYHHQKHILIIFIATTLRISCAAITSSMVQHYQRFEWICSIYHQWISGNDFFLSGFPNIVLRALFISLICATCPAIFFDFIPLIIVNDDYKKWIFIMQFSAASCQLLCLRFEHHQHLFSNTAYLCLSLNLRDLA